MKSAVRRPAVYIGTQNASALSARAAATRTESSLRANCGFSYAGIVSHSGAREHHKYLCISVCTLMRHRHIYGDASNTHFAGLPKRCRKNYNVYVRRIGTSIYKCSEHLGIFTARRECPGGKKTDKKWISAWTCKFSSISIKKKKTLHPKGERFGYL